MMPLTDRQKVGHLPPPLTTFHILLVLMVPRKPILAERQTSPKVGEGKGPSI